MARTSQVLRQGSNASDAVLLVHRILCAHRLGGDRTVTAGDEGMSAMRPDMNESRYTLHPIGVVRSALTSLESAPLQGDEGAPEAWLEITAPVAQGLVGIAAGDELVVLTWLHRARREVLQVHPRGTLEVPLTGVFATRSPDRPNPRYWRSRDGS